MLLHYKRGNGTDTVSLFSCVCGSVSHSLPPPRIFEVERGTERNKRLAGWLIFVKFINFPYPEDSASSSCLVIPPLTTAHRIATRLCSSGCQCTVDGFFMFVNRVNIGRVDMDGNRADWQINALLLRGCRSHIVKHLSLPDSRPRLCRHVT